MQRQPGLEACFRFKIISPGSGYIVTRGLEGTPPWSLALRTDCWLLRCGQSEELRGRPKGVQGRSSGLRGGPPGSRPVVMCLHLSLLLCKMGKKEPLPQWGVRIEWGNVFSKINVICIFIQTYLDHGGGGSMGGVLGWTEVGQSNKDRIFQKTCVLLLLLLF